MNSRVTVFCSAITFVAFLGGCATTQQTKPQEPAKAPAQTKPAGDLLGPGGRAAPASAAKGDGSYTVVRGDHLWGISGKSTIYGNPFHWPLIYKANRDKIKDADLIYPGQVFNIDRGASQGDVDAAVRHARTRGAWSLGAVEDSDQRYLGGR